MVRFQNETSVFKFSQGSVDGKKMVRFQSETSVFKSPRVVWTGPYTCTGLSLLIKASSKCN